MKSVIRTLFFVCAFLAAFSRGEEAADEQPDRAFLLVRREFSNLQIKEGVPLTITVEVFNAGNSEAKDVSVNDAEWDAQLFRTEGEISGTFDSIAAGATKTFSYTITAKVPLNRFEQPELTLSYKDGENEITSQGPRDYIKVHSKEELLRKKILEIGGMITLGMITSESQWIRFVIIFAGSFSVYALLNIVRKLRTMMENSKRKSVLKEFGFKDE